MLWLNVWEAREKGKRRVGNKTGEKGRGEIEEGREEEENGRREKMKKKKRKKKKREKN